MGKLELKLHYMLFFCCVHASDVWSNYLSASPVMAFERRPTVFIINRHKYINNSSLGTSRACEDQV